MRLIKDNMAIREVPADAALSGLRVDIIEFEQADFDKLLELSAENLKERIEVFSTKFRARCPHKPGRFV